MITDKLIQANGSICEVEPKNGEDYTLEELQAFVVGYIEIVYLYGSRIMVVNDDGIGLGFEYNGKASILAGQPIVGTVLVCDSDRIK